MSRIVADLGFACLKNPIMPASGCFGWGREYSQLFALNILGAVVTKAVTPEPRPGNPGPRVTETPGGVLNAIGLENRGLTAALTEELPWLQSQGVPILVNVAGRTEEDYVQVAEALGDQNLLGLELNLSCPNVREGGISFGTDAKTVYKLVSRVRQVCPLPLVVKLTPNVTDITEPARGAEAGGADALTVINTLRGMAINVRTRRPVLGNVTGGLSGPAIKPVALSMVWQVATAVSIPVIGCGGIAQVEDVVEFLLAGAAAVQVGSAAFADPLLLPRLVSDLESWLEREKCSVEELVGAAHS
ncbi:MAG: dihydroorotate dehydrogenase [Bacillota bacterium]|jgi:dihydroorotate dehydrogenase (NAD+) catalytic subunit|nr:dihydroorotate dehydrogenase [Bacillota bacterium]HOC06314.1 dihydroorotate dehydrogenase [Bacillota bacterium]HPZ22658.1 dihydroorotate dehydrogenase [Bacillota bacterium]HQD20276.1 dihydroorotate dehydrogenase [Bacillota bacterium]